MSKIQIIEEVLNLRFKPENQLILIEEDIDKMGKKFQVKYPIVKKNNIEISLFRFDPNHENLFPYFSDTSGLKKICDYILFAEQEQFLYVFLIELKKGRESAGKQLNATEDFVNYIIKSAKRIGKKLDENIAIRLIRICDQKIMRSKTKIQDKSFEYVKNYCDYNLQNFYIEPLMHD